MTQISRESKNEDLDSTSECEEQHTHMGRDERAKADLEDYLLYTIDRFNVCCFFFFFNLECPLDCKEIKTVNPKGNQS